ncbi:GNAT family N-acetyltransferase [Glycomyces rhizosphaerae]|uniref:GNAT family N-acetyltransferase n=1 Tax=Glycomyces rhizosphaerae TaxID=2054422 RepID=A0ABV7PX02_9ACTN
MTVSSDSAAAVADLHTDRLVLRVWTAAEAGTVTEGGRLGDWAEDFPEEGDKVMAPLITVQSAWLGPFGHRLIVERESGLVVGSIGLFWPPTDGAVELGYGVVPSRRGRGYASEATLAMVEHAYTATEVEAVFAHVEPSNPASVRVLEKSGFAPYGPGEEEGTVRYDAPAPH